MLAFCAIRFRRSKDQQWTSGWGGRVRLIAFVFCIVLLHWLAVARASRLDLPAATWVSIDRTGQLGAHLETLFPCSLHFCDGVSGASSHKLAAHSTSALSRSL
jgi:hypothetical protein